MIRTIIEKLKNLFSLKPLTIKEVIIELEHRWDNDGREKTLCDYMEYYVVDYKHMMEKKDYDSLVESIVFEWSEIDLKPQYLK